MTTCSCATLVMALRWVRDNIAVVRRRPGQRDDLRRERRRPRRRHTDGGTPTPKGLFAQAISESPGQRDGAHARRRRRLRRAGSPRCSGRPARRRRSVAGSAARRAGGCAGRADRERHRRTCWAPSPIGPTFGTDYLPHDPRRRDAAAARRTGCRSSWAPTPTRAGCSPGSSSCCRPPSRYREALLARSRTRCAGTHHRRLPGLSGRVGLRPAGRRLRFGTAAWQIAEAHSAHAPTYRVSLRLRTRTLHWSGFGATHATELFAVFDMYRSRFGWLLTAARRLPRRRAGSATTSRAAGVAFSRTGVPGDGLAALRHRPSAR